MPGLSVPENGPIRAVDGVQTSDSDTRAPNQDGGPARGRPGPMACTTQPGLPRHCVKQSVVGHELSIGGIAAAQVVGSPQTRAERDGSDLAHLRFRRVHDAGGGKIGAPSQERDERAQCR